MFRSLGRRMLVGAGAAAVGFGAAAWATPAYADTKSVSAVADIPNVHVMQLSQQMRAMHTIIRDKNTTRQDFVFFADRLMRLLVEEALSFVPFQRYECITPTGDKYDGLKFTASICAVSIMRAGESMEQAIRQTCRDIRIGKILIQRDEKTGLPDPRYNYAKLPEDISKRWVFLLDPMLATGGSAMAAVKLLKDHGVREDRIIFVNVLAVEKGLREFQKRFPKVQIVTTDVDPVLNEQHFICPGLGDFGDRYFGTAGQ